MHQHKPSWSYNEYRQGAALEADAQPHQVNERTAAPRMKRELSWVQLTGIGVGCTIGAGIFVVTGYVAHQRTGPALFLSYIIAGVVCFFAALSYAEFASMVPTAGSAYTYAHATMGKQLGWIIGWDLILEYGVAAATVCQGWSHYFVELLRLMRIPFPTAISRPPWDFDKDTGALTATGAAFDLPAVCIAVALTTVLVRGIRNSAYFNTAMVAVKVFVIMLVILVGAAFTSSSNYSPFMPYGFSGISFFGYTVWGSVSPDGQPAGVLAGAALVFFAYTGFDAVTCQSEEAKDPQRDVPRAVMASLGITTVLYIAVSLVLCGMVKYTDIDDNAPLSTAFGAVGQPWAEVLIAIGALAGVTSVGLVTLMGQPRILLAMARDKLLPAYFGHIHPQYGTPARGTIITGIFVSFFAALVPLTVLVELVSIGTLLAFLLVSVCIVILRRTRPGLKRPFRTPCVPWFPLFGALLCLMLMLSLPGQNWVRLLVWFAIGQIFYFFYGRHHGTTSHAAESLSLEPQGRHGRRDSGELELTISEAEELESVNPAAREAARASGELDPVLDDSLEQEHELRHAEERDSSDSALAATSDPVSDEREPRHVRRDS